MPRYCTRETLPDGTVVMVTREGNPNAPCVFCVQAPGPRGGTMWPGPRKHSKECDFPVRRKAIRRCNRKLCDQCATKLGEDLDLCPVHAAVIESVDGLGARLRPLLEQYDNPISREVACDLIEQSVGIPLPPAFRPKSLFDWCDFVTERAAIFEYEGGFPRDVAERKALALSGDRPK